MARRELLGHSKFKLDFVELKIVQDGFSFISCTVRWIRWELDCMVASFTTDQYNTTQCINERLQTPRASGKAPKSNESIAYEDDGSPEIGHLCGFPCYLCWQWFSLACYGFVFYGKLEPTIRLAITIFSSNSSQRMLQLAKISIPSTTLTPHWWHNSRTIDSGWWNTTANGTAHIPYPLPCTPIQQGRKLETHPSFYCLIGNPIPNVASHPSIHPTKSEKLDAKTLEKVLRSSIRRQWACPKADCTR